MTALDISDGLAAALEYSSARDWPIFPCTSRKVPLVNRFADVATTDLVTLFGWWGRWPDALPALPTGKPSGLCVLDIDVKDPRANGCDTLAGLGLSILPETPMSHTRSGGVHVYFSCHPSVDIRNSIGEHGFGPGIDVRGTGGLVVLPSVGPGCFWGYWWDPVCNFDTVTPVPAPAWLGHRQHRESAKVTGQNRRFDAETVLAEACDRVRSARPGDKWRAVRREAFIVGCLVRDQLVPQSRARHELDAALLAIKSQCNDFGHAIRGMESAFAEGRAAARSASR